MVLSQKVLTEHQGPVLTEHQGPVVHKKYDQICLLLDWI